MKIENYIKWFLFAFLSLFLVACKPTAKFEYSPIAPSVGEVVKFDASKSTVYKAKEGNKISIYAWNFGDGSQGTGQTVEHTYTAAGQYTVALTVTDSAGQTNSITQKVTVSQTTVASRDVTITVHTVDGASIPNVTVTIQGQSATTDQNGLANLKLTIPQGTQQVVAKFIKEGFITQSIVYDVANLKAVSANLLAIKQTVPVTEIANAQVIESQHLGAKITIPANAFVKADGSAAMGAVNVEFTPWDITNADLNAMPANGVAKDAQGNIVNLISAGMITATFKDANGQELQLAKGKTADIQMNLPLKSINNTEMKVGTQIPMWHFDEAQGLWIEEGIGQVVASTQSSTGLAVHATVSHFSTWNWDFKYQNAGSVFVQCQSKGVGIPCEVHALVTLDDGSAFSKQNYLPAEGATVINMPSSGSIYWKGSNSTSTLIGEKNSGTTGNVIIELKDPATDNFINCILPDGTTVGCSGKMNNQFDFSVAKDGGRLFTGTTDPDGQLDWTAQSKLIYENNAWVQYKGSVVSGTHGNVTIKLDSREVVYSDGQGLSFKTVCTSWENQQSSSDPVVDWDIDPQLSGEACNVTVEVYTADNQSEKIIFTGVYGKPFVIALPGKYTGFDASGKGAIRYIQIEGSIVKRTGFEFQDRAGFESEPDPNSLTPLYLYEICVDDTAQICQIPS